MRAPLLPVGGQASALGRYVSSECQCNSTPLISLPREAWAMRVDIWVLRVVGYMVCLVLGATMHTSDFVSFFPRRCVCVRGERRLFCIRTDLSSFFATRHFASLPLTRRAPCCRPPRQRRARCRPRYRYAHSELRPPASVVVASREDFLVSGAEQDGVLILRDVAPLDVAQRRVRLDDADVAQVT